MAGTLAGEDIVRDFNIPMICETEELEPKEEHELEQQDIILISVRCAITFICLVGTILVFVGTIRSSQQRYKSWRLYLLTSLMVLAWIGLSLYRGISFHTLHNNTKDMNFRERMIRFSGLDIYNSNKKQ